VATIFLPQIVIGLGNGLLLPTSIAGAVSIRPQVAGTASGMTGFIQMPIGAVAAQLAGHVIAHASDAMPMLWLMLAFGLALAAAFLALVRQRGSSEQRAPARPVARIGRQRNPGLSTLPR
jgi:DHA1 family bicyclomycin/chloramphenicol resistance-like MFS transporter